jgi:hypothetical protein
MWKINNKNQLLKNVVNYNKAIFIIYNKP